MTIPGLPLVWFVAILASVTAVGVDPAAAASRCNAGRWSIDEGPVTLGPFAFEVVGLREGVPVVSRLCRAQRWVLARVDGETRLRALFSCRPPDATRPAQRVPLRLRARIFDDCAHMAGVIGSRRLGAFVTFTATRLEPCGGIAGIPCPEGQFCELPAGECSTADLQGRCEDIPAACPELHAPVCGCDGLTYGNDCLRQQAAAQLAHDGACEEGCLSNAQCASDAYCEKPRGHCDARGKCTPRPLGCPDNVDPVCGCDQTTYFNACEAAAAGVSVAQAGECPRVCGGLGGAPCAEGEFCEFPTDTCFVVDLPGRCVAVSDACPEFYSPVCGCDGVTYANDCFRQAAKAQKAHDGPCECVPKTARCEQACDCYAELGDAFCDDCPLLCPNCGNFWQCKDGACVEQCGAIPQDLSLCSDGICGGIAGVPCPTGQVCELPLGFCGADLQGRCVPVGLCTQQFDPVCGCDGKTYSNDCVRRNAGVQRAHDGACG